MVTNYERDSQINKREYIAMMKNTRFFRSKNHIVAICSLTVLAVSLSFALNTSLTALSNSDVSGPTCSFGRKCSCTAQTQMVGMNQFSTYFIDAVSSDAKAVPLTISATWTSSELVNVDSMTANGAGCESGYYVNSLSFFTTYDYTLTSVAQTSANSDYCWSEPYYSTGTFDFNLDCTISNGYDGDGLVEYLYLTDFDNPDYTYYNDQNKNADPNSITATATIALTTSSVSASCVANIYGVLVPYFQVSRSIQPTGLYECTYYNGWSTIVPNVLSLTMSAYHTAGTMVSVFAGIEVLGFIGTIQKMFSGVNIMDPIPK